MDINSWNLELGRLIKFFEGREIPQKMVLEGFMTVHNTRNFIDTCIAGASNVEGNLHWNGNLHRLQLLEKEVLKLENEQKYN